MSIYTALFSRHKKKINIQFHSLKELKVKNVLSDPREAKCVAFEWISKQKFVLEKNCNAYMQVNDIQSSKKVQVSGKRVKCIFINKIHTIQHKKAEAENTGFQ